MITRIRDLQRGDMITEIDTPEGPWYEVVHRDARSLTIDGRLRRADDRLLVSLEYSASGAVLRRVT